MKTYLVVGTAIVSCYLMWAITFMAQLHPLIAPRRTGIREEYLDE